MTSTPSLPGSWPKVPASWARWSTTRTSIGSATSGAQRESSSGWHRKLAKAAEGRPVASGPPDGVPQVRHPMALDHERRPVKQDRRLEVLEEGNPAPEEHWHEVDRD